MTALNTDCLFNSENKVFNLTILLYRCHWAFSDNGSPVFQSNKS